MFHKEGRFDDAHTHIAHAKSHTVNDMYLLGCVVELQAMFWFKQKSLEKAKAETLHAIALYERIGATQDIERCRQLLQLIEKKKATNDGKYPEIILFHIPIYHSFLSQGPGGHRGGHIS